jgi:galactokinase
MEAMREVKELFQKAFRASPAVVVEAPGRLELLGNHTDYNRGLVMALAVDKYIYVAATPRSDAMVELVSSSFPGSREKFFLDKIEKNPATPWANYTKGVLLELRKRRVHLTGFNGAIHGTIPFGAGLSSSAALEMASALAVRQMFPFTLTEAGAGEAPRRGTSGQLPPLTSHEKIQIAKVGQAAESAFVGANVGLLDQISSLFGREGQVIQIDFLHTTVEHTPMTPGVAIVVCDSGVKHDLSEAGGYNELRAHCEAAARKMGVDALRSVNVKQLQAAKGKLSEREFQCAYHIVGEHQRVVFGDRALRAGDIEQFGQYLLQSHESSRDFFKNSIAELDTLVDIARTIPGCYGARLTGGGFGGATINLVKEDSANAFMTALGEEYFKRTKIRTEPWRAKIVNGAH